MKEAFPHHYSSAKIKEALSSCVFPQQTLCFQQILIQKLFPGIGDGNDGINGDGDGNDDNDDDNDDDDANVMMMIVVLFH